MPSHNSGNRNRRNNTNPKVAKLEEELLEEINKLGIGPQGFGGRTTALAVNIETFPAHIASMPVAINIQCHAARHQEAIIGGLDD
jgi:fumarate hydratase subunit alpha